MYAINNVANWEPYIPSHVKSICVLHIMMYKDYFGAIAYLF